MVAKDIDLQWEVRHALVAYRLYLLFMFDSMKHAVGPAEGVGASTRTNFYGYDLSRLS